MNGYGLLLIARLILCSKVNNDNEHHTNLYNQHHQATPSVNSRVLELSDRFIDIAKDGTHHQPWLVMFFAPWCGHCKRLEPIYNHVAQSLHSTPIRVGRIDCTRFPNVGVEFKIHGYPTIMFVSNGKRVTFEGDRELDEIVNFATRMSLPPIKKLSVPVASQINENLFFGITNNKDTVLYESFVASASHYHQHHDFYEFNEEEERTAVFVVKHNRMLEFKHDGGNVTRDLIKWIANERFFDFLQFTRNNLQQVFRHGAFHYNFKHFVVVAVVFQDKLNRIVDQSQARTVEVLRSMSRKMGELSGLEKTPTSVLYGYIGDPELGNSVVARTLILPTILVIEKREDQNHKYYVFEGAHDEELLEYKLEQIRTGNIDPDVHANTVVFKAQRFAYDAVIGLTDMWEGNPVLTTVLFGLPLGFLSLILYSVCCGDILDAADDDELEHDKHD